MEATTGERVKALREKENLSQTELGGKIGLAFSTISAIENERSHSSEALKKIAKHFKISLEWLLNGTGEAPKGVVVPIRKELGESPWKDEAYQRLKAENERLVRENDRAWALVNHLTGGKLPKENFNTAFTKAGATAKVVRMFAPHSGARVGA